MTNLIELEVADPPDARTGVSESTLGDRSKLDLGDESGGSSASSSSSKSELEISGELDERTGLVKQLLGNRSKLDLNDYDNQEEIDEVTGLVKSLLGNRAALDIIGGSVSKSSEPAKKPVPLGAYDGTKWESKPAPRPEKKRGP